MNRFRILSMHATALLVLTTVSCRSKEDQSMEASQ